MIIDWSILSLYVVSLTLLIFIILFIDSKIKLNKLNNKYIEDSKLFTSTSGKLSMIEYYYRNFKEGVNPYTILRDIHNVLDVEEEDE